MKIDRRAVRTRKALHEALIALIRRKDYEAITVQDILDQADIGRSTFYAHYAGKEDLLRSGFEELRELLARERRKPKAIPSEASEILPFSLALFEHACEHKQTYRALVGSRGGAVAGNEIRRILSEAVRSDLRGAADGIPEDVRVRFVVDTFLGVLSWSLGAKPGVPPPEMNTVFRRLVIDGLGRPGRGAAVERWTTTTLDRSGPLKALTSGQGTAK